MAQSLAHSPLSLYSSLSVSLPHSLTLLLSHLLSFSLYGGLLNYSSLCWLALCRGEACVWDNTTTVLLLMVILMPSVPQLDLQMREAEGEVWVGWGVSHLETWDLQLSPSFTQVWPITHSLWYKIYIRQTFKLRSSILPEGKLQTSTCFIFYDVSKNQQSRRVKR